MSDPEQIANWQRLNPSVTTSGRLTAADVGALADLGVRHVINLALAESPGALAGERELFEARAVAYTHIPVPFDAPTDEHYDAFCAALEANAQPVHVHCIMNWRVSAFFYRYNCARGMPEAEARALMQQQWTPENYERAEGPAWVRFIAG